jgi:PAX-interacting protein 1
MLLFSYSFPIQFNSCSTLCCNAVADKHHGMQSLSAAVSDIGSVVNMIDRIAGSAPGNGSRAAVGEDLVAMTKCRLQARNFITHDGSGASKKMKRDTSAMPLNVSPAGGSVNDSLC